MSVGLGAAVLTALPPSDACSGSCGVQRDGSGQTALTGPATGYTVGGPFLMKVGLFTAVALTTALTIRWLATCWCAYVRCVPVTHGRVYQLLLSLHAVWGLLPQTSCEH